MITVTPEYNNKAIERLNKAAWVKAGTAVTATSAAEAAKQAGLDWTVSLTDLQAVYTQPVGTDDTFTHRIPVDNKKAVLKTMPGCDVPDSVIGVVGNKYKLVQNIEVFNALDTLIDSGDARYAAAGEIKNGSQVWMVLELPHGVQVADDPHVAMLLVKTGHDGSSSVVIKPIIERLFCANQINGLITGNKKYNNYTYRMTHTTNQQLSISDIRNITQLTYSAIDDYQNTANRLLSVKMSRDKAVDFFKRVWALPSEIELAPVHMLSKGQAKQRTIALNARDKAWMIYSESPTQENIRDTAFGAWQAVIEYADHHGVGGADRLAAATLSGRNDKVKTKALSLLTV
jgi:phage/plasmid-like protein (TIGR03299 family)